MPRKLLIRTAASPYHITNRSNNRERFYVELPLLWDIFMTCFNQLEEQFGCVIHSFVLMNNHYHLIISTPEANIGEAMKYLHREVAKKANRAAKRINHFFGTRYKWSVIAEESYYWNCVKYVFRNPVRAKICKRVEDYEFSSLNRKSDLFTFRLIDSFHADKVLIQPDIEWLNESYPAELEARIGKGLRRRAFQLPQTGARLKTNPTVLYFKKGTVT